MWRMRSHDQFISNSCSKMFCSSILLNVKPHRMRFYRNYSFWCVTPFSGKTFKSLYFLGRNLLKFCCHFGTNLSWKCHWRVRALALHGCGEACQQVPEMELRAAARRLLPAVLSHESMNKICIEGHWSTQTPAVTKLFWHPGKNLINSPSQNPGMPTGHSPNSVWQLSHVWFLLALTCSTA